MKKLSLLLLGLGLYGAACGTALAQGSNSSVVVGNPGSSNSFFIQETYGITTTPAPSEPVSMEPLPDSPGVEVAPPPGRLPEPAPFQAPDTDIDIDETVIED